MSRPIVIHVLRPYASEDEYLARERSSIEAKTMLLIDQPALPSNTAVVFEVSLTNGQKPIRAEGIVLGYVAAQGVNPGGVRVRFKRFGAATKAFIDRALSTPGVTVTENVVRAPEVESVNHLANEPVVPLEPAPTLAAREPDETSGVHRKVPGPVTAPLNREALLARLRGRRAG